MQLRIVNTTALRKVSTLTADELLAVIFVNTFIPTTFHSKKTPSLVLGSTKALIQRLTSIVRGQSREIVIAFVLGALIFSQT